MLTTAFPPHRSGKSPLEFEGLSFILAYFGAMVTLFSFTRLVLFLSYWTPIMEAEVESGLSFLYGLRMDIMAASILIVVPVFVFYMTPKKLQAFGNTLLKSYLFMLMLVVLIIEVATFPFFSEFNCRPNEMFINYLQYPREVFFTIWESERVPFIALVLTLIGLATAYTWYGNRLHLKRSDRGFWRHMMQFGLCIILLFMGIRSSLGHRPANLADAAFSHSHLVNEITGNSIYSLGFTVYSRFKYGTDTEGFGNMPSEVAIQRVKSRLSLSDCRGDIPFMRTEESHFTQAKPRNLVIILEESLGAQFVESFGGESGLTPNLDCLSEQGLAFQNLYATGTRSVRGMEAIVAGFLPVPGESVIKRNKAQRGFFTIGQALRPLGYRSSFIYGGEKRFDNMGRWYLGNGFDTVVDEGDYEDPLFRGIWGVCDEDLFSKAHHYFETLHGQGDTFFSVVFTTSFHTPFEFPEGRIRKGEPTPEGALRDAVKYADYALGLFFEMASGSDYYNDTVFLVIADHDVRVFGSDLIPIDNFKIPGLIIGANVPIENVHELVSQPDAIATALDFIGIPLNVPILGRSVFAAQNDIAMLQYHNTYALMTSNEVAIVQAGKDPETFVRWGSDLIQSQSNLDLEQDLLAFIQTASYLYEQRLHIPLQGDLAAE